MKFTVVESKWLRGGHGGDGITPTPSQLLDQHGQMCCMGFLALACGVPREALEESCYWSSSRVLEHSTKLPDQLLPPGPESHGKLAQKIYDTNDATRDPDDGYGPLTEETRKAKLTALFAQAGIEVEFVPCLSG
jgi:hypothetical protein